MSPANSDVSAQHDLSARTGSFLSIWVLPILVATIIGLVPNTQSVIAAVWSAALVWTGVACLLNARRCGRVHCFVAGPILLIGAALAAMLAFGVLRVGALGLTLVVWVTLILALLTYGLERIWGRYRHSNQ